MRKKERKEVLKEFAHKNKDLLCIFGNPETDELMVSFGDKMTYVTFPKTDKIIFRALFDSLNFKQHADSLLVGIMKGIGSDEKMANEFYQAIGGSIQSINESLNGKNTKKRRS